VREWVDSLRPEQRAFLRAVGGIALAAAALSLFIRKSSHNDWGSFALLLVLLVPCVLLYGAGLGLGDRELAHDATPPLDRGLLVRAKRVAPAWQSVFVVLGVVLVPFVLFQFLDMLGGNTGESLNVAWIFLAVAGLALYAGFATGVSYAALLASLALIVAWLSFSDKVFNPSASGFRWLLLIAAGALVVAALQLERLDVRQAPEFVTGAGIAAVAAAVLGLIGAAVGFIGSTIANAFSAGSNPVTGVRQHQEWDVLLILVAVALIWYGNRRGARGPTYVGGLALTAFVVSIGAELTRLFARNGQPEGAFVGWPLLLLVIGAAGLVAGYWVPAAQPPPPAATQPVEPVQ
jgi:hypothetical protein